MNAVKNVQKCKTDVALPHLNKPTSDGKKKKLNQLTLPKECVQLSHKLKIIKQENQEC